MSPDPAIGRYICPGHRIGHHYTDGCGEVHAVVERRAIYVTPGRRGLAPVLVCPDCGTRLLPTRLEIEQTRGRA